MRPGCLSAWEQGTQSGEGRDGARPALPAWLQRWSVMIRRSSSRVSRAMASEVRRPPPRFRASTKLSILSDNSEPLAAAPGILKEAAVTVESTPTSLFGFALPGRTRSASAPRKNSSVGDGGPRPSLPEPIRDVELRSFTAEDLLAFGQKWSWPLLAPQSLKR